MANLLIDGDELVIELSTWERLGAVRSNDVRVPLAAVESVEDVDDAYAAVRGLRVPGTAWPGRIKLGTWRRRGGKDFIAVTRHDPGVVVELTNQSFDRLIVTGERPDGL